MMGFGIPSVKRGKLVMVCIAIMALVGMVTAFGVKGRITDVEVALQDNMGLRQEVVAMQQPLIDNMASLESSVNAILSGANTTKTTLDSLATRLANLESNMVTYANTQANIISRIEALEGQSLSSSQVDQIIADLNTQIVDAQDRIKKLREELVLLTVYYNVETRYAYYNTENGFSLTVGWCPVKGNGWVGQQFVVNERVEVSTVQLYLGNGAGVPSSVNLRIYNTDINGYPTGSPIVSNVFDASGWVGTTSWRTIHVSNCPLNANTKYALILVDTDATDSNRIDIGFNYGGTYTNGAWVKSTDGGVTWSLTPNADAGFEIWGVRVQ